MGVEPLNNFIQMDKSYMFMFQFDLLTMKTELLSQIKLECKCTLLIFSMIEIKSFWNMFQS